jgi:hypothetical protein
MDLATEGIKGKERCARDHQTEKIKLIGLAHQKIGRGTYLLSKIREKETNREEVERDLR